MCGKSPVFPFMISHSNPINISLRYVSLHLDIAAMSHGYHRCQVITSVFSELTWWRLITNNSKTRTSSKTACLSTLFLACALVGRIPCLEKSEFSQDLVYSSEIDKSTSSYETAVCRRVYLEMSMCTAGPLQCMCVCVCLCVCLCVLWERKREGQKNRHTETERACKSIQGGSGNSGSFAIR